MYFCSWAEPENVRNGQARTHESEGQLYCKCYNIRAVRLNTTVYENCHLLQKACQVDLHNLLLL